jgi:hypothetical protein
MLSIVLATCLIYVQSKMISGANLESRMGHSMSLGDIAG